MRNTNGILAGKADYGILTFLPFFPSFTVASDEITNEVLLEHIQAYGKRFDSIDLRFDKMDKRMDSMEMRFDKRFDNLEGHMGKVENRLDGIDTALQRLYKRRLELVERVGRIEEEELPRIKQHVGMV